MPSRTAEQSRCRLLLKLSLALLVASPSGAVKATPQPAGDRHFGALVSSIEMRSDVPIDRPEELWNLVDIASGEPLAAAGVRRTLLNLQAAGIVGQSEVRAYPDRDSVRVVVSVRPRLLVASMSIEGELCVRRSRLESLLEQVEATPLSESRIIRGIYRMQDWLVEEGYRNARVQLRVDLRSDQRQADVLYLVECGEATTVDSVAFEGDPGAFTAAELAGRLRLTEGKRLQTERREADARRLEEWLIASGYRTARVEGPSEMPGSSPGRVRLVYRVDAGPRFEIVLNGGDEKLLRRAKLLELLESERFDEALLVHVLGQIRRFYQERGHYGVDVDWRSSQEGDEFRLEIIIRRGPVSNIADVGFRGNEIVASNDLVRRMATGPARVFGSSGFLVDSQLSDDLANLRAYYARQGFPSAVVGPAEVTRENQSLYVVIPIEEGVQHRLVDLTFVGVEEESVRAVLGSLGLTRGGPFHTRLLEEALDEVRAAYEDAGYLSAQVTAELLSEPSSPLKSVEIRVLEGPQVRIGRIILRGNAQTRSEAVRRSLRLQAGEVVSRRSLLAAQQRLYRLGIFSRVEVSLAHTTPFASERDVVVRVEEGRSQRVSFGLGYDSEDGARMLLGYGHPNLGGRAVSSRVDLRISDREEQFRALLRQPALGRWHVPVTFSLFAVEEAQESFDSKRRGAQIEAHRQAQQSRLGLLYTYKLVDVIERPEEPLTRLGIDRNLQESEISSLTPSVLFDYRDDPLVPTTGWTLNLQSELAFPLLSADAAFAKLFGHGTVYWPLSRLGVVAGSLRVGAIEPYSVDAEDTGSLVPISEQFFAGGRTTHRAYERDLLGVRGDVILLCRTGTDECSGVVPPGESAADYRRVAVGGNALLLFNLDYRFPIAGPLGGTAFVDAGNVWAEWRDFESSEIKVGGGIGLRYLSPIGPLRLEVGWKLDREVGESTSVIFLSFGNPF